MTVWDEDYTQDDMDAALEWQAEDALRCSCGGFVDETMDPANHDRYDAQILVCHRCAAADRAEKAFRDQENPDTAGMKRRAWETD